MNKAQTAYRLGFVFCGSSPRSRICALDAAQRQRALFPKLAFLTHRLFSVQTVASRSTVSGYFSTSLINTAAWAFGLARPCSQFSRARGLVCR